MIKKFLVNCWQGKEKLWKAFWIPIFFSIILIFLSTVQIINGMDRNLVHATVHTVFLPFYIWFYVSVWRCAFNVKKRFLGYVARVVVVLDGFSRILKIVSAVSYFIR